MTSLADVTLAKAMCRERTVRGFAGVRSLALLCRRLAASCLALLDYRLGNPNHVLELLVLIITMITYLLAYEREERMTVAEGFHGPGVSRAG
jgi:hypothetical protein